MEAQGSERSAAALDDDGQAARGADVGEHLRALEAPLGRPVGHHRRPAAEQGIARLRSQSGRDPVVDAHVGEAVQRAEGDGVLGGHELHHGADLQAQQPDAGGDRLLHEVGQARALQRVLAEPGHGRLLGGASASSASASFCSVMSDMTPCQRLTPSGPSRMTASSRTHTGWPSRCRSRYSIGLVSAAAPSAKSSS